MKRLKYTVLFFLLFLLNNNEKAFANSEQRQEINEQYVLNMNLNPKMKEKGRNVGIAILDTGIDKTHKDLNIAGGVDCAYIYPEPFSCGSEGEFKDENGHGTHLAGIISAQDNDFGMRGIAPDSNIYNVTVAFDYGPLHASAVTLDNVKNGLIWIYEKNIEQRKSLKEQGKTEKNLIDIANMSFELIASDSLETLNPIFQKLDEQGVILVASAGNESCNDNNGDWECIDINKVNESEDNVVSPALSPYVISVSNVDWERIDALNDPKIISKSNADLTRRIDSSFGKVEISAMGTGICSTKSHLVNVADDDLCNDGENYQSMSGTSQAAPVICGILALYKERFPNATSMELKNMLYEQSTELGTKGKDRYFGYGLANPNPPKHQPINETFHLNGDYKIYSFPNKTSETSTIPLYDEYLSTLGKTWDESKQRFTWYYIKDLNGNGIGWINSSEYPGIKVKTDRYEVTFDGYTYFYDSPDVNSNSQLIGIDETVAGTVLTNNVSNWNSDQGTYGWYQVSIPEYNIKDKWARVPDSSSRTDFVYERGLTDLTSGKIINDENISDSYRFFDNYLGTYFLAQMSGNSSLTYEFDKPVNINKMYFKSGESINSNVNISVEMIKTNGEKMNYTPTQENLNNTYFNIPETKDVKFITIKNNSTSNLSVLELDFFGTFDKSKPIQKIGNINEEDVYKSLDSFSIHFSGYHYLYSEPNIHSNEELINVNDEFVKVLDYDGWDYNIGYYKWLKISIPKQNIYNKWIQTSDINIHSYDNGLFNNVYNKIVQNSTPSSFLTEDHSNSYYNTTFNPGDSITYQFEKGISSLDWLYLQLGKNNYDINNPFKMSLDIKLRNHNYWITYDITGENILNQYKKLSFSDDSNIQFVRLINTGTTSITLQNFELFGDYSKPTISNTAHNLFLNGYVYLYDNPNQNSINTLKNIKEDLYLSENNAKWSSSYANNEWYQISIPELNIEEKWVNINSGIISKSYENGLTDTVGGKISKYTTESLPYWFNNREIDYGNGNIKPGEYVNYQFYKPVKINQMYLKTNDQIENLGDQLEIELITTSGEKISHSISEEDLFKEKFPINTGENKDSSITSIIIKNEHDKIITPTEIDFFGNENDENIQNVSQTVTLNSYNYLYNKHTTYSPNKFVYFSEEKKLHVSKAFGWNSDMGKYYWYQIDEPDSEYDHLWVQNPNTNFIYENGLLDNDFYLASDENTDNLNYLFDNKITYWQYTSIPTTGKIHISFSSTESIKKMYIKFYEDNFLNFGELNVRFNKSDGTSIDKIINESDFSKEIIDLSDFNLSNVSSIDFLNQGTTPINLVEFEIF